VRQKGAGLSRLHVAWPVDAGVDMVRLKMGEREGEAFGRDTLLGEMGTFLGWRCIVIHMGGSLFRDDMPLDWQHCNMHAFGLSREAIISTSKFLVLFLVLFLI